MSYERLLRAAMLVQFLVASNVAVIAQESAGQGANPITETVQQVIESGETGSKPQEPGGESEGSGGGGSGSPRESGGEEEGADGGRSGEPDETTPRGVVDLFLTACNEGDFARASRYLDLGRVATQAGSERAARLARQLKVVLDQNLWIDLEELSEDPRGNLEDGAPRRDRLGSIESDRGTVQVALERVETGEGVKVWRFSSSTVARIPYLYEQYGYGPLGEYLPEFFFTLSLFEIQLWQWIGIMLLLLTHLMSWFAVWIIERTIRPVIKRSRTEVDDRVVAATLPPARVLLTILFFSAGVLLLRLSVPAQKLLTQLEKAATVVVIGWLTLRVIDVFSGILERRFENQDRRAAIAVLPMGRRTVKVVAAGLVGIAVMQSLGFNVTGLIASLGIGGLAVALAAQRSLENMFAGMSLISDQPVRVGDFCRFGDKLGWVEDIGLRSTRVRTLERSVVAVPNSQFADLHLDNLAKRDYIRFYTVLGLRYETRADQLRHVIVELRKMLVSHPKVSLEPFWRVRFIGFGDYSLNVEVFVYTRTTDYGEYREIQEDLLLRIIDIVEASGTAIAFPSQTTYLGRDHGIDEERAEEAVDEIGSMRKNEELPFPGFSEETLKELSDSLSYPPEGAVGGK